ncbi:hypothetical protein [Streptomyces sp. NPDC056632]|uniref:hypothetical protein n=1 Tax=Streptomyces sp. NPDC056632 TaxID=3345884 RepID=UPI0036C19290
MKGRIPLDDLTSDALDQLYTELAEAQRQVIAWKTRAGIRATQRRRHERRAERAEAAIERVRALHARDLHNGDDCAGCTRDGLGLLADRAFIATPEQT